MPKFVSLPVAISLALYVALYSFIFLFGVFYIYRLLKAGPAGPLVVASHDATPSRPMSVVKSSVMKTPLATGQAQEARGD